MLTDRVVDTAADREWLLMLREEIWNFFQEKAFANISGNWYTYDTAEIKRELTLEELAKLKEVAQNFIVVPHNAGMGFNFGVTLYDHPPCIGLKPEGILTIEGHHLPKSMDQRFDGAWKELSPLSHNEKNKKLLEYYGLDPLREKSHYDY